MMWPAGCSKAEGKCKDHTHRKKEKIKIKGLGLKKRESWCPPAGAMQRERMKIVLNSLSAQRVFCKLLDVHVKLGTCPSGPIL